MKFFETLRSMLWAFVTRRTIVDTKVVVIDDVARWALQSLKEIPDDDVIDVKVCVGRCEDETIIIVYAHESMIHEDMLRKSGACVSGGGDSIRLFMKDGAVNVALANLASISVGPLRSEFRDIVVMEFRKLIA